MPGVKAEGFKQNLIDAGIVDPDGVHHEFVSGRHGQKIDFDQIPKGSALFWEWVSIAAQKINALYPPDDVAKLAVLSVANGTNRIVKPVARALDRDAVALLTEKNSPKSVRLAPNVGGIISDAKFDLVVVLEDVGTEGTTTATAVTAAQHAGASRVEAITTWQRMETLVKLDKIGAVYHPIIYAPKPSYTPEECETSPAGFCYRGWEFIPRSTE